MLCLTLRVFEGRTNNKGTQKMRINKKIVACSIGVLIALAGLSTASAFIITGVNEKGDVNADEAIMYNFGDATDEIITNLSGDGFIYKKIIVDWNSSSKVEGDVKLNFTLNQGELSSDESTEGKKLGDVGIYIDDSDFESQTNEHANAKKLSTDGTLTAEYVWPVTGITNDNGTPDDLTDDTVSKSVTLYLVFFDVDGVDPVTGEDFQDVATGDRIFRASLKAFLSHEVEIGE